MERERGSNWSRELVYRRCFRWDDGFSVWISYFGVKTERKHRIRSSGARFLIWRKWDKWSVRCGYTGQIGICEGFSSSKSRTERERERERENKVFTSRWGIDRTCITYLYIKIWTEGTLERTVEWYSMIKKEREWERNENRSSYVFCFSSFGTDSLQNDNDYKNSFASLQDEQRRDRERETDENIEWNRIVVFLRLLIQSQISFLALTWISFRLLIVCGQPCCSLVVCTGLISVCIIALGATARIFRCIGHLLQNDIDQPTIEYSTRKWPGIGRVPFEDDLHIDVLLRRRFIEFQT